MAYHPKAMNYRLFKVVWMLLRWQLVGILFLGSAARGYWAPTPLWHLALKSDLLVVGKVIALDADVASQRVKVTMKVLEVINGKALEQDTLAFEAAFDLSHCVIPDKPPTKPSSFKLHDVCAVFLKNHPTDTTQLVMTVETDGKMNVDWEKRLYVHALMGGEWKPLDNLKLEKLRPPPSVVVTGRVHKPGQQLWREGLRFKEAIANAGGLTTTNIAGLLAIRRSWQLPANVTNTSSRWLVMQPSWERRETNAFETTLEQNLLLPQEITLDIQLAPSSPPNFLYATLVMMWDVVLLVLIVILWCVLWSRYYRRQRLLPGSQPMENSVSS